MNSVAKTLSLSFVMLAAVNAHAGKVKSWDLSKMSVNPVANVQKVVVEKIKAAVENYCLDLSNGNDTVELVGEVVRHTDYYNYSASQLLRLEYSSFKLVRYSDNAAYELTVNTGWDYDLPVPMVDALVEETEQCKWRPLN